MLSASRESLLASLLRDQVLIYATLTILTKRLCTEYVDPLTIEPILAKRPIPLDKGNGEVRPIGEGEVIRRIIGKCVSGVGKQDVIDAYTSHRSQIRK